MRRLRPLTLLPTLLASCLIAAFGSARAAGDASGTVTVDGRTWEVADAVATSNNGDIELWFAQRRFDRDAWADDGEFGTFDTHEFVDDADGMALRIDVDEDTGGYGGHTIRFSSGSSSGGYSGDYEQSLELGSRSAERVAGTVKISGDTLAAEIRFDLAVKAFGPLARAGTPLPADGGDPGKVLRAMVDATHAGDLDRMAALSHPERRAGIEEARAAGEAEEMLKMVQLFTPRISRITGGTVDGDRAWVEFEGEDDGSSVRGTGELERIDGEWYLRGIQTRG